MSQWRIEVLNFHSFADEGHLRRLLQQAQLRHLDRAKVSKIKDRGNRNKPVRKGLQLVCLMG